MWAHGQLLDADTVRPTRGLLSSHAQARTEPRYLACSSGNAAGDRRLASTLGRARAWTSGGPLTPATSPLPVYYFWRFAPAERRLRVAVRRLPPPPDSADGRCCRRADVRPPAPTPTAPASSCRWRFVLRRTPDDIAGRHSHPDALRTRLVDAGYDISLLTSNPGAPPLRNSPVRPACRSHRHGGQQRPRRRPGCERPPDPRFRVAAAWRRGRQAEPERYCRRGVATGGRRGRRQTPTRRASTAATATLHRK
jgi:hypothetical protein